MLVQLVHCRHVCKVRWDSAWALFDLKQLWNGKIFIKHTPERKAELLAIVVDTPLCQATRSSDCRAVEQLLAFNADPNLCERGGPPPIFWAIRMASAEYVQQLLEHRADPLAKEIVYMEGNVENLLAYNALRQTFCPLRNQALDSDKQ